MTIDEIKHRFMNDLKNEGKSDADITRKYISFGTPYIFQHDETIYLELKETIAKKFSVHPDGIKMVGSAKLGFSISPKKIWRPIHDESDIDMVIISSTLFDEYWQELFEFNNIENTIRSKEEDELYREFIDYLFKGWIRPDKFPFKYSKKDEWFKFFKSISYKKFGEKKITGAIYRNNYFFEKYHELNIKKIRAGGL